jgi:opacity protein-like surface antigen
LAGQSEREPEYALTESISLKAEYLYVDFGDRTVEVFDPRQFPRDVLAYRFDADAHVVRAGLNIRFGSH